MNSSRISELKAFNETKAGVKGLVDAGITQVPRIFYHPPNNDINKISHTPADAKLSFPTIDLQGFDHYSDLRIENKVRKASETWGFFQVINHGIPVNILEEMKQGVRRFYEQDANLKKEFFTRNLTKKVVYNSNFDLYSAPSANWRDTILFHMIPDPPHPQELPAACRDIVMEYTKEVEKLGDLLFELLSEALGLKRNHLKDLDCAQGLLVLCHYYPPCPQPRGQASMLIMTSSQFFYKII